MRRLVAALDKLAPKEVTVTFIGESGSGKEVLARRVHNRSPRSAGPFIPINCAAIPETLFESELFGHERGAFTGANARARGKVEAALHGTLFLDEIGELAMPLQAKLLRFLEHRRFMRVGGITKIDADVRIVCATLRPLEADVAAGRFRADLFYRIQGVSFTVPPLRERVEDIAPLVKHFVRSLCAQHRVRAPTITREAMRALRAYAWPGNVRELRNVLETACLLREGRAVGPRDLPASVSAEARAPEPGRRERRRHAESLDKIVCGAIQSAITRHHGALTDAAAELEVSVRTLQRYIAKGRVQA